MNSVEKRQGALRARITVLLVLGLSSTGDAIPEIISNGPSIQLKIDAGGDLQVASGSGSPQSILNAISLIPGVQNNVSMVQNTIQQINANLSTVAVSLSQIGGVQRNVSAINEAVSALNTSIQDVNVSSIQRDMDLTGNLSQAAARIAQLEARSNCLAGITTLSAIPLNSQPIPTPGMCNLTLGGTCRVMCKQGYRANSSINVAFQKTAVGSAPFTTPLTDANLTVDGITSEASRYIVSCTNIVCWVLVDLHQPYMITEFDWLNGHSGCVPGGRACSYDAHCKHYVQVWTGPSNIPGLRTIGADFSTNWTTISSSLVPTSHGINHDAFTPIVARYVKLVVDNRRDIATCYGGSYLRIREIQILTSSTKDYTCGAAGLTPVDSTPLECDAAINGTVV
eukprot:m.400128 g.400128  ORF g.400128 m.400128 type:complete len:396 (+) comp21157_c0_seq13:138-1325(+)